MRVYVIRHGESETNLDKKWTGWLDVHLTDKGKDDARKAGEFLKQVSFEKIYTSDLCRAVETAEIAIPNCSYERLPLLREINVGTLANKPLSILTEEQRAHAVKWGYEYFGGESKDHFYNRISQVMKMLETLDCETVAMFSHGGWLRGMLDTVVGTRLPGNKVCCNNCTIAIFEYTNEIWRLHSWINLS
ncbi:MAG: histidine phosphatase family protein [Lachnospiraceae bacterium]|nr:histidine phosphatase family protein [Lachnospiraceae bacterium]